MSANTHRNTPTLSVIDGRGLQVREVTYLLNDSLKEPQPRITRSRHDIQGQDIAHYSHQMETADLRQVSSLSGVALLTESNDAGWRLEFFAGAGKALEKWDSRGTHWQTRYDSQLRPVAVYEKPKNEPRRAIERFTYADSSAGYANTNRCGQLIRHDDSAGKRLFSGYDLKGKLLSETRHLLKNQQTPDWPEDLDERDKQLETGAGYTTTWWYAPTGETLRQKDARGNTQHFWFDVAGQLKKVALQLHGRTEQRLILDRTRYNAQGQIESQVLGEKINHTAEYASENGRMKKMKISLTDGGVLQEMHYAYDAVGNVLNVEDHSKPVQHNNNQQIRPINTYVYDSLYQLVQASGREEQGSCIQRSLPEWSSRSGDRSRLLNFVQKYTYDARGNLIRLQHQREGNNYTREMRTALASNRALAWKTGDPSPDFAEGFDANGNLQLLQAGNPLEWDARNQLQRVTLVERAQQEGDTESYVYDGNGQRIRKQRATQSRALTHIDAVIYLPGLEIREKNGKRLDVITVQAGGCNVRCLHWRDETTPAKITNDALRYTFNDHLGANTMELNAEGNLLSEEGYYPFGGTAWRAAPNHVEANYRTIRYSGKECDASGLYYYGSRYYAPWLQRWISADPAGFVDGLNLYRFVSNNPQRYKDHAGLTKYEIGAYSSQPGVPAPASTRAAVQHDSSSAFLDANDLEHYRLAYDTIWTTRSLLHTGAGNQIGSIVNSTGWAPALVGRLRFNIGSPATTPSRAQHAVAAGTGHCDEYAAVSSSLLSSSARNSAIHPVNIAVIPGHTFTVLGDPNQDPLVIDPWVTYPLPHLLSESRYPATPFYYNVTPRMPQDPTYEIRTADVNALLPVYMQTVLPNTPLIIDMLNDALTTGAPSTWVWSQMTSSQQSADVNFVENGQFFNFAHVPQGHYLQIANETQFTEDFRNLFPTGYFRRF
ncbi:RHS repeat-associated core domain-containing protein [Pseudomonas sp. lyk4-40-TSB-59a]|uniref:RHS repeat domain-containing protein n=1 Tax=Pseudomonas sp. lyk4-40-TSB-59a TaxID=3040314 RepID=UPI0025555071|nr:RHS repeat-associated core domain-containing protein [Pseudomonas sp. lyk4-40-TSB-59a]